jgi:hypothetical protein
MATPLTEAHLRGAPLSTVTRVDVWGAKIDDATLLRKAPLLVVVSLSDNSLCDAVCADLAGLSNLAELYLRNNKVASAAAVALLPKTITHLMLEGNPIAADQKLYEEFIIRTFPALVKLDGGDVAAARAALSAAPSPAVEALLAAAARAAAGGAAKSLPFARGSPVRPTHATVAGLGGSGAGSGAPLPPPRARVFDDAAPHAAGVSLVQNGVLTAAICLCKELDSPALERLVAHIHAVLAQRGAP